jgi:hypothetical protein
MIAEFGVGEFPKSGSKAQWFHDALERIPSHPRIQAAIYWHERWQNEDGSFSNLRINSSPPPSRHSARDYKILAGFPPKHTNHRPVKLNASKNKRFPKPLF